MSVNVCEPSRTIRKLINEVGCSNEIVSMKVGMQCICDTATDYIECAHRSVSTGTASINWYHMHQLVPHASTGTTCINTTQPYTFIYCMHSIVYL